MQETAALVGDRNVNLSLFVTDITDRAGVEGLLEKVINKFGAVDGIINNDSIIQPFIRVNDLSYEVIERVMNINFYDTLYLIKTFLPHLLTRPETHIVDISSMGGFLPVPGQTIYGASKAAVKLLTEGLHSELSGTNVRVTVVFPGSVSTNIISNSGLADRLPSSTEGAQKILSADKAAAMISEGMEQNRYRVLIKHTLSQSVATVISPETGIVMDIYTDEPGLQFYSGNFMTGKIHDGKGGKAYGYRSAFCLETQHFPDTPNQSAFA